MTNRFEWFVAWRYLFNKQRKGLASLITYISIGGVTVGVAALIVTIAVMDGIDHEILSKTAEIYPHLRIRAADGGVLQADEALMEKLRGDEGVRLAVPVLEKQAIAQIVGGFDSKMIPMKLLGLDHLGTPDSLFPMLHQKDGTPVEVRGRDIMLGRLLSIRERIPIENQLQISATNPQNTAMGPMTKTLKFDVRGYTFTGMLEFDDTTAFVDPETLRKLFRMESGYDYIFVKLKDPFSAEAAKARLGLDAARYRVTSWSEENREFFGALKLEKFGMFVVLMLVVLVAAFNIVGTLILMVLEKTREIGIMKALGSSRQSVARIFLIDGMLIGGFGTLLGALLGGALCYGIMMIRFDQPLGAFYFDRIPVELRVGTMAAIMLVSAAICAVAALYPARQAARLNPVEALRHD